MARPAAALAIGDSVTARRAALALLLALALPAGAAGGASARATLHTRVTSAGNRPGTAVLYDPASQAFALDGYLVPSVDERYGSVFASLSADGSALGGDLRWRLALDTGELRSRAYPEVAPVCLTRTGTGLGPRPCPLLGVAVPLEETRLGARLLASNGRPLDEEVRSTLLVREAWAALSFGRAGFATVRAGRKRVSVGDGFVYDDYATGAELALDLGAVGPPFSVTASLFQPTRDFPKTVEGVSPFLALRADWLPSLFEHAGVFLAFHRDRTGSVGELFRGAIVERLVGLLSQATPDTDAYRDASHALALVLTRPVESDASIAWIGTSGSLAPWRGHRLGWTAALAGGRMDRVSGADLLVAQDVTVRGRMLSVRWETSLGERLGLGAFLLHLSGGEFPVARGAPATGEYGGFLGIAPYVTATNLFFGGGLSESFAARQSAAPGVNGRGVTAPGVGLSFDPTPDWGLEVKAAWLRAPVAGPLGGRVYGTELDAVLAWAPRGWLLVGLEVDVLWPGDFFAGRDTLYKTVLAVDLLSP